MKLDISTLYWLQITIEILYGDEEWNLVSAELFIMQVAS